jgi:hypothetical protein
MTTKPVTHTYFMMVKTTNRWLALPPKERFAYFAAKLEPLLRAQPAVKLRYFDSEAFSARYTDVLLWETSEAWAYQAIVEALRETEFWGTYFEIVEIVPAIENAYAIHYGVTPLGG